MASLLFLLFLTVLGLLPHTEAAKCDPNIIQMMKENFWNNGNCVPEELMRTNEFLSPEIIKITSENYYPDEKNISCLYAITSGSSLGVYVQYVNSTVPAQLVVSLTLVEKDGALYDEENDILYYALYFNRFGVGAIYKCYVSGDDGVPEGLVKISAGGYDRDAYDQAIEDLKSLGITMRDLDYGDYCVP